MTQLDKSWRSIILFGRNAASYKFALAKSLIYFSERGETFVTLDQLATPFADAICEHLKHNDRQALAASGKFLDACRSFNRGEIEKAQLIEETVARGFVNVIDAFHVVGSGEIPDRFFIDDRKGKKGITLTDQIHKLRETLQWTNFGAEVEARWRLVETAWELNISRNLIEVIHDAEGRRLFVDATIRRVDVTSSRDALNGYQRGKCFYCFDEISIQPGDGRLGDVDHFLPWVLEDRGLMAGLNGVWNLVLACKECNRGSDGKFHQIPSLPMLERLGKRNEYLIRSHHPLRETLIRQTGLIPDTRQAFLRQHHEEAKSYLHHIWEP